MKFSLHGTSVRFVIQTVNARPSGASSIVHGGVELLEAAFAQGSRRR